MKEFKVVAATRDLEDGLIKAGYEGTILDIFSNPVGYHVEFDDVENDDVFIVTCHPGDIEVKKVEPQ